MLRLTHARDGGTERKKRKKTLLRARLSRGVYRGIGNIVVHAIRASLGGYCVIADLFLGGDLAVRFFVSSTRRSHHDSASDGGCSNACATRFDYHPGKIRRLEKGREKRETERGGVTRVIENCSTALHVQRERQKERKKRQEI